MDSKYPRSVRCCLPRLIVILEVIFILLFFFYTSYDMSSKDQRKLLGNYRALQDVTVMAVLGLGFLISSLRRHGWSSVAFNLFTLAFGVQWAVLVDGFLNPASLNEIVIEPSSIQLATVSAISVLISVGTVLGKVNLVQLVLMALLEVTAFVILRVFGKKWLDMDNHLSLMYVHVFAAYFGLIVDWCLSKPLLEEAKEKDQTATSTSLFAMLGTLFLWMFWPSFNSALLDLTNERKNAMFNTHYALAVSTVTAISVSALSNPRGKINVTHIHNAVLAGGVAVGASCHLISSPWISMVLGLVAGLISIGGAKCLPVCLNRKVVIHDSCGVHYTFGLPGLLGGIAYIVQMVLHASWAGDPMIGYQALIDVGALSWVMAVGMVSGLLTGCLLKLKIWKAPHEAKYFDDQTFWKFHHLASGF
ncbi:PREDICTED: blood group Rh(CE) polypeptide [Ceratotherium simum simum]|uniref:Blood group Rh(CE) polypeptide n=1 Tax=Ceratotherium simum simum TaxID=73337 RepID=A0ABM1CIU9_CERSS|nr:PREDICTED: blood group Rh(CE) polypeptide [Ceratotherium simum simum]